MKRFLLAAALALAASASPCSAQRSPTPAPDHTMEALLSARATLISRYVQSMKVARGVAVCGDTDLLTGDERSYLCIYVYRDAVKEFLPDFINFAKEIGGPGSELGVGGVPVSVEMIGPVPNIQKEPNVPKPEPTFPTRKA